MREREVLLLSGSLETGEFSPAAMNPIASPLSEMVSGSDSAEYDLLILGQSLCAERCDALLDRMEGLDFEPGFEEVLKVNSEMKEGISLRTPDSVVPVLRDEIVYKSDRSASPNKSAPSKPAQIASRQRKRTGFAHPLGDIGYRRKFI
jgi:hypothetical protein